MISPAWGQQNKYFIATEKSSLLQKSHTIFNRAQQDLHWRCTKTHPKTGIQGPVVQSVVSLSSLLRVILLTFLADSIHNILTFFAEKMWVAFALHSKSYSHYFNKKFQHICISLDVNFNESLTNDVFSFEQLGPGFFVILLLILITHASTRYVYCVPICF